MVDASDLSAIQEDVPFYWDGAKTLKEAFKILASLVEDQRPQRMAAFTGAVATWQGEAKDAYLAKPRHVQGDSHALALVRALLDAVADIEAMERAAHEENDVRRGARDSIARLRRHEAGESWLDDVGDWMFGSDDPVPEVPEPRRPEPNLTPPAPDTERRM